jgi:glutathione peroxidase
MLTKILQTLTALKGIHSASNNELSNAGSIYKFKSKTLTGKDYDWAQHQGKVTLVVNTASKCGFTPQYKGLETLYEKYKDQGFLVVGFPANDFGRQEPGTGNEIQEFCEINYGVKFPIMEKNSVKGKNKQPLFKELTESSADSLRGEILWNFEKFLIGRDGKVIRRYRTWIKPDSEKVVQDIESALQSR